MIATYLYNNNYYHVTPCVMSDIPSHYEKVYQYWLDLGVNLHKQKYLLERCIEEESALKVVDNNSISKAFIYYSHLDKNEVICYSLWFENKRMFAILMRTMREHTRVSKFYFQPHKKGFIPFQFIVDNSSMKPFNRLGTPLEINMYSTKAEKLYRLHFVNYGIKKVE